jgi:hypothetical protein
VRVGVTEFSSRNSASSNSGVIPFAYWRYLGVGQTLEQMARSLVESGDYRVTSRLEPQAKYHPPDSRPKLIAAVVDVETTGTDPDRDKIIELGICPLEYDRQTGRIYKVLGSWEWFEDPGGPIPSEITHPAVYLREMIPPRWSRLLPISAARWSSPK